MARPLKETHEKNSCVLPPVRCTGDERQDILTKAQSLGLSLSEYIRQMALNGKVVIKQSKYDVDLIDQIRRIGINLNQQTKRLNGTGEVSPELKQCWSKLNGLLDDILMIS